MGKWKGSLPFLSLSSMARTAVVAVCFLLALFCCVQGKKAEWEKVQVVQGLDASISIKRDFYGVPHVYGTTTRDALFGEGYVHAEDRLFQMDVFSRAGMARMSELLGLLASVLDEAVLTLGGRQSVLQDLEELTESERLYLKDYSAGVNAAVTAMVAEKKIPPEYKVLFAESLLPTWSAIRTLGMMKVIQFGLTQKLEKAIPALLLADHMTPEQLRSLYPDYPASGPTIVDDRPPSVTEHKFQGVFPSVKSKDIDATLEILRLLNFGSLSNHAGSNNWVLSPEKTTTNRTIFCNDPHLPFWIPPVYHEVGVASSGADGKGAWHAVGASIAGLPGIWHGHNEHIAWGPTVFPANVLDLYVETPNPHNPQEYKLPNGTYGKLIQKKLEFPIRGLGDRRITVTYSRHGPIISDLLKLDKPLALKWGPGQRGTHSLRSVPSLLQATNWDEFRASLSGFDLTMNFLYADTAGNIGYQATGILPTRRNVYERGILPAPGDTDEYEWIDWIPFDELPRDFNPPKGWICSANNLPTRSSKHYLGWAFESPNRARRISARIEAMKRLSLNDAASIQLDDVSVMASHLVPHLLELDVGDDPLVHAALELLRDWDYTLSKDSAAAGIFELTFVTVVENLVKSKVDSKLAGSYVGPCYDFANEFLEAILDDPHNLWWDDATTSRVETRGDQLLGALQQACAWWKDKTHWKDPVKWEWGRVHHMKAPYLVFEDPLVVDGGPASGDTQVHGFLFLFCEFCDSDDNLGTNDDDQTPHAQGWLDVANRDFTTTFGAVYRIAVDVGNWSAGMSVLPGGSSGVFYDKHFRDQLPLYMRGAYRPLVFEDE